MCDAAKSYRQVWDGQWEPLERDFYIACCGCSLTHRVQIRVRKGVPEVCFTVDKRRTSQIRRWAKRKGKKNGS